MSNVYIVSAVRTAVGKKKGGLAEARPDELLACVIKEVIDRVGVPGDQVEDVISGTVYQIGEQGFTLPRLALIVAGLPYEVPGVSLNRQCGSSLTALNYASAMIAADYRDCIIAGGCEIMSKYPIGSDWLPLGKCPFGPKYAERVGQLTDQGQAAELIAQKWNVSREELDEFSLRSHQKAAAAQDAGKFDEEIVPFTYTNTAGEEVTITRDEGIRRGTSMEKLAGLTPVFSTKNITAGNSSQVSDGASAVLLVSERKLKELKLEPIARVVTNAVVGADPVYMLTGPIYATPKVLDKAGMKMSDIDLFEINEAFASIPLAWGREHHPDWDKVNVNGGAIALGHPVGNTGTRLVTSMLHELKRRNGRYGLVSLCTGGGMAPAAIFERL